MHDPSKGIPEELYNELVRYTKYASGAYQALCPRPMGHTLVTQVRTHQISPCGLGGWHVGSLQMWSLPRKVLLRGMTRETNSWFHSGAAVRSPARLLVNLEVQTLGNVHRWRPTSIRYVPRTFSPSWTRPTWLQRCPCAHRVSFCLYERWRICAWHFARAAWKISPIWCSCVW